MIGVLGATGRIGRHVGDLSDPLAREEIAVAEEA